MTAQLEAVVQHHQETVVFMVNVVLYRVYGRVRHGSLSRLIGEQLESAQCWDSAHVMPLNALHGHVDVR